MPLQICPACQHANLARARSCHACGASLRYAEHDTEAGALVEVGEADLEISLREFPAATGASRAAPVDDGLILADPPAPRPPRAPAAAPPAPAAAVAKRKALAPAERAAARAERRAEVRRARLSQSRQRPGAALTEVLVFEPDAGARAQLKDLLGLFGFHVHETATLDEARNALAERERLAAVFLSVSFVGRDEADAVALCQLAKARAEPAAPSERAPALLLVSTRARPVENIKAKLAGCDAFLVKPLTRGGVARAMEDCGVALPSDARRA